MPLDVPCAEFGAEGVLHQLCLPFAFFPFLFADGAEFGASIGILCDRLPLHNRRAFYRSILFYGGANFANNEYFFIVTNK